MYLYLVKRTDDCGYDEYDARDHRTTQPIHEALGALRKLVECEE